MMQASTSMNPVEAYQALMRFAQQRGEGALRLALHAAVPQSFRPDLLHLLRLNFVPEAAQDPAVEADVLLAPFCEDLGSGYFQFDGEVRRLLLDELVSTYATEIKGRVPRVANFLLVYIERLSRTFREQQDRIARDYLEIQRWVALAFLAPDAAAEQLAAVLAQATDRQNSVVRVQLGGLVAGLSIPLVKYPQLLTYAAGVQAFEAGQVEQGRDLLERLPDEDLKVGRVKVRSPGKVLRAWRAKDLVTNQVRNGERVQPETKIEKLRKLKIFLCHSASDKPAVRDLYQKLRADGFDPWLDEEDLLPGQRWEQEIPKAVRAADVIIVCLSQDSISKQGYYQKEIQFSLDIAEEKPEGTIFLIPLKLEECEIPERLRWRQTVSLFEEEGYEKILRSLHARANDLGMIVTPRPTSPHELQTKQDLDSHRNGSVFICYAREDAQFVLALAQYLKERGIAVWLDQWHVPPGANWNKSIDDALDDCARVLVVLSPAAVESQEVEGEWVTALDKRKPIFPVLAQPCRIPSRLRLFQRVDLIANGLGDTISLNRLVMTLGGEERTRPEPPLVLEVSSLPQQEPSLQPEIIQPSQEYVLFQTLAPTFRNSIGMEFILIPAGEFQMGSADGFDNEKPVHLVRITKPFYLGTYQVTQAQWQAVMGNNPSRFTGDPNRPVERVSWHDAQRFLQRLNERDVGKAYRLPTEAEWEYAARAGSTGAYCFGDDEGQLKAYAWYAANAGGTTHPVGQRKPNAWGLYDMHGNVWEWCDDGLRTYTSASVSDPLGPTTKDAHRVLRGGFWYVGALYVRSADRSAGDPGFRGDSIGFRCASSV